MNCIIIEDEIPAQELLASYVERTNGWECIGVYGAISQLPLKILEQTDLILLDIQLPEINGLDFLSTLKHKPSVIITSAYNEYALDAFEEEVTGYLLKPFSYKRFLKAVMRVNKPLTQLVQKNENDKDSFFIYVNKSFYRIEKSKIKYISAEVDYINIHTTSDTILLNDSLTN